MRVKDSIFVRSSKLFFVVCFLCLIIDGSANDAHALSFVPVANYDITTDTSKAVTSDFNGDGKLDIVYLSNHGVTVLLGNGDGTFHTGKVYIVAKNMGWVAAGDFNRDNKSDLVVSYDFNFGGGVSVMLGNGDGTFQSAVKIVENSLSTVVRVGDFNGDGKDDLAVVVAGGQGVVSILLGNGDGTFQEAVNYSLKGVWYGWVQAGDFNGDGKADLAVGSEYGLSVLLGNGDGTFQEAVTCPTGDFPFGVADFNGDGKMDLAVTSLTADATAWLLLGNGDGTFQETAHYFVGSSKTMFSVGDFDGDGNVDLAGAGDGLVILPGNGDGAFLPALLFPFGYHLADGDFNGDGKWDFVMTGDYVLTLLNNTAAVLVSPPGWTFGDLNRWETSLPQTFVLTNTDETEVTIGQFVMNGQNGAAFTIQNDTCTLQTLAPAGTCTIDVLFKPGTIGEKFATISATTSRPETFMIPLRGDSISCPAGSDPASFGDLAAGYWASAFVKTLSCNAITVGCGGGLFCPEGNVTRDQMAVFIVKAMGQAPADVCTGTVFADVNAGTVGDGFCRYIEKFRSLGLTAGCAGGLFCPDDAVTRAQMAVFIAKALGENMADACNGTFNDVDENTGGNPAFCKYIGKFSTLGITSGCVADNPGTPVNEAMYCPWNSVTRAQMAVFLTKAFLE